MKKIVLLLFANIVFAGFVFAGSQTYTGTSSSSCITTAIPNGSTNIIYTLSNTAGDVDLYYYGTTNNCTSTGTYVCRPYLGGIATEICGAYSAPGACGVGSTNFYAYVNQYSGPNNWTLNVTWDDPIIPTLVNAGSDITICSGSSTSLSGSATTSTTSGSMTFSYSGSGWDDDNFFIGGVTSGMPVGSTISSIQWTGSIASGSGTSYCPSRYEIDFWTSVYVSTHCNSTNTYNGLNGLSANGQQIRIRSWDTDVWSVWSDYVYMNLVVVVNYNVPTPTYSWSPPTGLSDSAIANPVASPTSTTNYTMTATVNGCSATDNVTVTVTNPTTLATSASATGTRSNVNSNTWVQILDNSCNLIAEVNPNNNNLGTVTATLLGNGNASVSDVCGSGLGSYAGRIFRFQSTNTWTGNVGVRLYITPAELLSLINEAGCGNANGCADDDDVCSIANVNCTKYPTGDGPGGPTGVYLTQTGNGTGYSGDYVEFSVTEFSDFYLHGSEHSVTLPVELVSLTAQAIGAECIQLDWTTATEINNEGFEIQRSLDGEKFEVISWHEGKGNTNEFTKYVFRDEDVYPGVEYYYRLKQMDYDGQFEYSYIVSASLKKVDKKEIQNWDFKLYPNPTGGISKVELLGLAKEGEVSFVIFDLNGQKVKNGTLDKYRLIDMGSLEKGTYIIKLFNNLGGKTEKLIKI